MKVRFDGKRALVTGAGKGIGRAVAVKLAEGGAEVVALSRTSSDLEELSKSIVAKGMIERGQGGSIVNVSSLSSTFGFTIAGPEIYSSSKAVVDQLTRNMSEQYGPHNIRVNAVNPTLIPTPMSLFLYESGVYDEKRDKTPLKKTRDVDDVAYPILFLLSDMASFISGVTLPIDGGRKCV